MKCFNPDCLHQNPRSS